MKLVLGIFMMLVTFSQTVQAQERQLVLSSEAISNLPAALAEAEAKMEYTKAFSDTKLPNHLFVAFPEEIPRPLRKAYAHFITLKAQDSYAIEVAATPTCDLGKSCLLGDLSFQLRANPTIYYDGDNKLATTPVVLHHGIQGFYTRGYPMADFWPAKLEWRYREVLYTLTWHNFENKKAFVLMANSVVDQLYKR